MTSELNSARRRKNFANPEKSSVLDVFDQFGANNVSNPLLIDKTLWKSFPNLAAQQTKKLNVQMSKNFGLTEDDFTIMCSELKNGNEALFEKVFLSHFEDCVKYLMSNYSISKDDACDATMDTLIQFRKRLIDDKVAYGNIRFLFTKIASQNFLKSQKELKRVDGLTYDTDTDIDEEELQILEKSINELGDACKELLKLNFYEKKSIAEIAKLKNLNAGTLRKNKQRCLLRLKNLFIKFNY